MRLLSCVLAVSLACGALVVWRLTYAHTCLALAIPVACIGMIAMVTARFRIMRRSLDTPRNGIRGSHWQRRAAPVPGRERQGPARVTGVPLISWVQRKQETFWSIRALAVTKRLQLLGYVPVCSAAREYAPKQIFRTRRVARKRLPRAYSRVSVLASLLRPFQKLGQVAPPPSSRALHRGLLAKPTADSQAKDDGFILGLRELMTKLLCTRNDFRFAVCHFARNWKRNGVSKRRMTESAD